MPFPIAMLVLPGLMASAGATTTATVSAAAVAGGVAAGAGGVGTGVGLWYYFFGSSDKSQPETTAAHKQSVSKQNEMTKKKVDDAAKSVASLKKEVKDSAFEVQAASSAVTGAAQNLNTSVSSMVIVQQQLSETAKKVSDSTTKMADSLPQVTILSDKTEKGLDAVASKLGIQTQKLEDHRVELVDAKEKVGKLTEIIDIQGRTIEQLTGAIQHLSDENDGLRTTITAQHQKYQKLETAAKKRLFSILCWYRNEAQQGLQ